MRSIFSVVLLGIAMLSCTNENEVTTANLEAETPVELTWIDGGTSGYSVIDRTNTTATWTIICKDGTPADSPYGTFCASDGKGNYATVNWSLSRSSVLTPGGGGHGYVGSASGGGYIHYYSNRVPFCGAC